MGRSEDVDRGEMDLNLESFASNSTRADSIYEPEKLKNH
jgi:hypothetical protein